MRPSLPTSAPPRPRPRRPAAARAALAGFLLATTAPGGAHAQPAPRDEPSPARGQGALAGPWVATLTQASGLELRVRLQLEAGADGRWALHSRPGAITPLIGRRRAFLGRLLGKLPPRGALVTGSGRADPAGDSTVLRGALTSSLLGRLYFTGALAHGRLVGELRRDSAGSATGRLTAAPAGDDAPVQDYRALAATIRAGFAERLYDPRLLAQPAWRDALRDLDRRLAAARDDADAMAAFYSVRPRLPTSHVELVRNPTLAATPLDSLLAGRGDPAARVALTFPAPGVARLRVTRWEGVAGEVDRAFARVDSARVGTLVLDMRGNPGGDVSAMTPATHLLRDSTPAGAFLGRGWYAAHPAPPTAAELRALPVLTESDAAGARQLMRLVAERGAVAGVVPPRAPRFDGAVYLLADRRSGSASEPLAHVLKATGRATLVGERTAGAMLMAPPRPLSDGWVLVVPEADYVAADGTRLEGRGVAPDVAVPSGEALAAVAARLGATAPYAGALLAGVAHQEAGRWRDAERAYQAARALAPDSAAPVRGLGFVYQARAAWDSAAAAFGAVLARLPDDRAALYQLGRTAALSGRHLARGEAALRRYLALPHDPSQPAAAAAYWRLGTIRAAQGATNDARRAFETALRLDPALSDARAALRALGGAPARAPGRPGV